MNQIDDSYDFKQFETNVIHRLKMQKDEEEIGVFAIRTVWDQAGKENRKWLGEICRRIFSG